MFIYLYIVTNTVHGNYYIKIEDNDGLKYFYYEDLKSVGTGMDKLFMQFNSKSVEFARVAKAKSPSRPSTSLFSEAFDDLMASFKKEKNETSKVFYSLVCEKTFQKNENFIVDFVMYEKRFKKIINMVKQKYRNASVSEGEDLTINSNANIEVVLTSPNIPSLKDVASFSWGRKYKIVQLGGMIPEDYSLGNVILEIDVLVEGIRVSTLKTSIRIGYDYHFSEMVLGRTDTKKVFFSYSSEDRDTVLEVVSRVRAGYGDDIEFFLDVLSLRSGENWEKRLYKEIKNNDTFCLVWSRHAYKSPWVQKEWKYALSHKGLRAFAPINLDSSNPDLAPIPKKLQKIHFANYKIIKQK